MEIHCIGLSHKTAPLEYIEKAQITSAQLRTTLERMNSHGADLQRDLLEMVLLSTCNRTELYAIFAGEATTHLQELLAKASGIALEDLQPHLFKHSGLAALKHLMSVAAGLDSMVIGEPQILGQVTDAYSQSISEGSSGLILGKCFHTAIHAGKRARTETDIATRPSTISSVAVQFAENAVEDLRASKVLVLGAGEMGELAVQALRKRGVRHVTVMNRTLDRAEELAEAWQARAGDFSQLEEELEAADILIASTGAPSAVVKRDQVERVMKKRPERPLVILDIAVPRNVETSAGEVGQVHLHDLDHLQNHLKENISSRKREKTTVEAIIQEELESFQRWYASLGIRPLIAELHQRAEEIRTREIERTLQSLSHLGPHEQEQIHAMTRALVNKILHAPITRLKQESRKGSATAYALVARDLFDLGEGEIDPAFPHRRGK